MKLKRLEVPSHWVFDPSDGPTIPARVGRPGWYGDRLTQTSWVELESGEAYPESWKMFCYSLKLAQHRALHPREREAIRELQRMGSCPKALSELLQFDTEADQIRETGRATRKFFLKRG